MRRRASKRVRNRSVSASDARKRAGVTAEAEHQAISAEEADQAFACLSQFETVLIAVSGGPDSLALLYLADAWAKRQVSPAPKLQAATVDHQLRAESAAEAGLVADHCARLGVPHTILRWHQKPWSGVMAAARDARYELLTRHLESTAAVKRAAVATAHTLDDQAETLIMRLKRGSGVDGLAAMREQRAISSGSDVQLVRPLLTFARTRLIGTLQARGVLWSDDPSNDDLHYERVRVRRLLQSLKQSGVMPEALARTARRARDASDGLDFGYRHFKGALALTHNGGMFASFERAPFDAGPAILRQRVLREVIGVFGGATPRPELLEIELAAARIAAAVEIRLTLGGATISAGPKLVRVWREPGRIAAAPVAVQPGVAVLWDERFTVTVEGGSALTVKAFGLGHADLCASSSLKDIPRAALASLPAFYDGEDLLGVPILTNPEGRQTLADGRHLTSAPIPLQPLV